jgi:hypothetical protein
MAAHGQESEEEDSNVINGRHFTTTCAVFTVEVLLLKSIMTL